MVSTKSRKATVQRNWIIPNLPMSFRAEDYAAKSPVRTPTESRQYLDSLVKRGRLGRTEDGTYYRLGYHVVKAFFKYPGKLILGYDQ